MYFPLWTKGTWKRLKIIRRKNSKIDDSSINVEVSVMVECYSGDTSNQVFPVFSMVICYSLLKWWHLHLYSCKTPLFLEYWYVAVNLFVSFADFH
jgi:hypothetical protein